MSKFKKGDKVEIVNIDSLICSTELKVGDLLIINENNSRTPWCNDLNGNRVSAFSEKRLKLVKQ